MKLLFVADVAGKPGRRALREGLPGLIQEHAPDLVIANGENASGGLGITAETYQEIVRAGVGVVTLGNHTWDKRGTEELLDQEPFLLRPANYPPGAPGRGWLVVSVTGRRLLVVNLIGRALMGISPDCPFRTMDAILGEQAGQVDAVFVDFHAEATSEKQAMAYYLDGRVAAVVGTHTHVQTADLGISAQGTASITDVGMTGPTNSVIGVDPKAALERFLTQRPVRFESAAGPWQLDAVVISIEEGKATSADVIHLVEASDR